MSDPINPDHYKKAEVEVIQISRHLNFNRGNIVKYAARAGYKNPDEEVQDLRKAIWYAEDEIQRITGEGTHAGAKASIPPFVWYRTTARHEIYFTLYRDYSKTEQLAVVTYVEGLGLSGIRFSQKVELPTHAAGYSAKEVRAIVAKAVADTLKLPATVYQSDYVWNLSEPFWARLYREERMVEGTTVFSRNGHLHWPFENKRFATLQEAIDTISKDFIK